MSQIVSNDLDRDISNKLSALISLTIKQINGDTLSPENGKSKTGDSARYLKGFGIAVADISVILGVSTKSVQNQLSPGMRKK